ncbi:GGDEF domain-containing protein [Nocardioides nitrophenolicus]|uniref:GGDEF domain-containing protein n=1 Tax=Nocardioides nitrophenolicus TaxID=60489 RepID=UPI00195DBFF5|nr:GGDEF domain-containing protein [Nocardioides nitrophenolicus]MBM7516845.1 diguanylate cyclase (GGDEF)-like protein [Nocardioides nitrophenolicus]
MAVDVLAHALASAGPDAPDSFTEAARRVVGYLSGHTPLATWSVSRVAGGEQVHVHVQPGAPTGPAGPLIETGQRVRWDDSFCRRMTLGAAHVVPDSAADPAYAGLPAASDVRAYVGYPISDDGGRLFGILCGVGEQPLTDPAEVDDALVELLSHLLSSHLAATRVADRGRRAARLAAALADTDALTGLMNRRGWDRLVEDAQERVGAFGDPVAVAVLDLDGLKQVNDAEGHEAGDDLLRRAAEGLRLVAGDGDRLARYGGDEFAILSNNVPVADLPDHFARFVTSLREHGVEASLGHAFAGPGERTVREAFRQADAAMYDVKRARRAG